jgi:IS1 family transposase
MNKLPIAKKVKIINLLVEGTSIRATCRIMDVSKNTVAKLLIAVGNACQKFHDEKVVKLRSERVQCDEIWSFVASKEKNTSIEQKEKGAGDAWTWVGMDADTKLIISWLVGNRDAEAANTFMQDVASRLTNRVQLTSDGFKCYLEAVTQAFGSQIDFAQLVKLYGSPTGENVTERKYSPAECTGAKKTKICGNPNTQFISTSYIERQNLTMRMHMRRFTRLTNAFSKKLENHCAAIALHYVYYNFVRIHNSLSVTPAMQAGLTKSLMTIEDIVKLAD